MEIYLVRHTSPEIAKGICYGQLDLDLSSQGQAEIQEIALPHSLKGFQLISSPLKRCTAIPQSLGLDYSTDPRLMEYDFGQWEGRPWDDIPRAESDPWMSNYTQVAPPGGETMVEMQARILDFLASLQSPKVVLFTHAGVIRILWAHFEGLPLEQAFDLSLDFGQVLHYLDTKRISD